MKWLLLLLISSPLILFGQAGRKSLADTLTAAPLTDLQRISTLIGNSPGARVDNIRVSDSGEYVTIVVRVHVTKADTIAALPLSPLVKLKTEAAVARNMSTVSVPPLPPPVLEKDTITALTLQPLARIKTAAIVAGSMRTERVPPLPPPFEDADAIVALPPIAAYKFTIDNPVVKMDVFTVPPLPEVSLGSEALTVLAPVRLTAKVPSTGKMDTLDVPIFEERKMPVNGMHLSAEGYSLLEKLEGFSPELYSLKDGGFTIGFGFFVPYGEGRKWDKGVTWEEAERMIGQKVPQYEDQVKRYINVPLTQNEFDALTMLAYNLGGFSKATSIVNDVNSQAGFYKLQSDWNRFVHSKAPGVARGLMNRRKDELGVKKYANYQPERKIQILKIKK